MVSDFCRISFKFRFKANRISAPPRAFFSLQHITAKQGMIWQMLCGDMEKIIAKLVTIQEGPQQNLSIRQSCTNRAERTQTYFEFIDKGLLT